MFYTPPIFLISCLLYAQGKSIMYTQILPFLGMFSVSVEDWKSALETVVVWKVVLETVVDDWKPSLSFR